jgi:hypothetical protein
VSRRVVLAEDDALIRLDLKELLEERGKEHPPPDGRQAMLRI